MDRLARFFRWLTILALLVGLVCWVLIVRPQEAGQLWGAVGMLLGAMLQPLSLGALGVGVVSAWAARGVERRTLDVPDGGKKVHGLDSQVLREEKMSDSPSAGPASVFAPVRQGRAARDRWRPRLEALLKGRRPDMVRFVDELLAIAVHADASDIHLQPLELSTRISLRVGGNLEEVATAPQALHAQLVRRLKVMADLVTHQTRQPQDGRFSIDTPRGAVDLRVSVLPTHHGEKVVLRLAQQDISRFQLQHLGLSEAQRQKLEEVLRLPQGVVVITGPTGSGKTTTLYAALTHIHETRGDSTQLATLEDPIEVELPFLSQTQVQRGAGATMADGLTALLRQDPNVLMVGEVRDSATAHVAIQGGLSGHLILTTLHAESALGVFPRLMDLGVEPFLVSSSVAATLSQRLLRRLCSDCRHPAPLERRQRERLRQLKVDVEGLTFYVAEGCRTCEKTGLRGRRAVFEMLILDPEMRRMVAQRAPLPDLYEAARARGLRSLFESALSLAIEGEISVEEALRVTA